MDQLAALTFVAYETLDPEAARLNFYRELQGELVRMVTELPRRRET